jgi:hypothetical protein
MCACRPEYKAVGGRSDGQWRVDWRVPGHEHRVYVRTGLECDVVCDDSGGVGLRLAGRLMSRFVELDGCALGLNGGREGGED